MRRNSSLVPGMVTGSLVVACTAFPASGDIVQSLYNSSTTLNGLVFGQTFLAEGGEIASIGITIDDANTFLGEFTVTVELFEGVEENLLDSATLSLQDGHNDLWTDFNFTGNSLVEGDVYSFRVSSSSGRGAFARLQHTSLAGDPIAEGYANGDNYVNGALNPFYDARFRITQIPAPGPLGCVLTGLALATRRRRTA